VNFGDSHVIGVKKSARVGVLARTTDNFSLLFHMPSYCTTQMKGELRYWEVLRCSSLLTTVMTKESCLWLRECLRYYPASINISIHLLFYKFSCKYEHRIIRSAQESRISRTYRTAKHCSTPQHGQKLRPSRSWSVPVPMKRANTISPSQTIFLICGNFQTNSLTSPV